MKLALFFLIFFVLNPSRVPAIDEPASPREPSVPGSEKVEKSKSNKKSSSKDKKIRSIPIKILLCDGRHASGQIETALDEISLHHEKDGIRYEKVLSLNELTRIRILNWKRDGQKKTKEGMSYQFNPSRVEITSTSKEYFILKGLDKTDFQRIQLKNKNGVAYLYTYWLDLQYNTGKWYSGLPPIETDFREDCHQDVVRTIEFSPSQNESKASDE
ncbi:MAG: hypothetical protein H7A24_02625 [Leptospiraceae bacterium]|nr:hypothetical protein [Leptospiraceae bacterium]MCP5510744.1 hypothetical protein [Leptospiraceae bacterium]